MAITMSPMVVGSRTHRWFTQLNTAASVVIEANTSNGVMVAEDTPWCATFRVFSAEALG